MRLRFSLKEWRRFGIERREFWLETRSEVGFRYVDLYDCERFDETTVHAFGFSLTWID